jgi:hypothetical protein
MEADASALTTSPVDVNFDVTVARQRRISG